MKIFYPTILTPAGYVLFAGLTMTPEREKEVAHRANARAFLSFVGREPMDTAEVSAWVREVLA